ncbi:glycosyltransferase family 2 protein [Alicyclobacillus mali (ex Roth et al. 2021)]|uniref:glycosyltransferase family 2 protein n=1 Tax=Alicyclobacillus mali (ex Roth et al. 2021) TaxID=1123961 RepID=UPI000830D786|nr:glycosyltransferase family 2 protein [Alicyclobacillus mali (ex Roth et al. 2021)]
MRLSACMIVKDEAHVIKRCLESLRDVADEVVIVDTGSTDATREIAESFGAKVYEFVWTGDFSAARNMALEHACGDYVLVIDADEFLPKDDGLRLRQAVERGEADAFTVDIINYLGSVRRFIRSPGVRVVRVFRRGFRYRGIIHEQILHDLVEAGAHIEMLDVELHHLGYLEEFIKLKNKSERNIQLLEKELADHPEDLFHVTNLMAEYGRLGRNNDIVRIGEPMVEKVRPEHFARQSHLILRLYRMLMTAYGELGEMNKLQEFGTRAMRIFPNAADLPYTLGVYALKHRRLRQARAAFEQALEIGEPKVHLVDSIPGSGSYAAHAKLGELWVYLGDLIAARRHFFQSLRAYPRQERLYAFVAGVVPIRERGVYTQLKEMARHDPLCLTFATWAGVLWGVPDAFDDVASLPAMPETAALVAKLRAAVALRQSVDASAFAGDSLGLREYKWLQFLASLDEKMDIRELDLQEDARYQALRPWLLNEQIPKKLAPLFDDLLLASAYRTLYSWMPKAVDRDDWFVHAVCSPLAEGMSCVEWKGELPWEIELRAMCAFSKRSFERSAVELERALDFEPTVRKIIIETDLALVYQNVQHAQTIVRQALIAFPSSELLHAVAAKLQVRSRHVRSLDELLEGDLEVNPHRAYQGSVKAMPLKAKIVKLHERACECVDEIRRLVESEDIMGARRYIEYVQDITAFLRSNLDLTYEAAKAADASYAYYYRMLVDWYLQPAKVKEQYEEMRTFWASWAQTWEKVEA